MKQLYLILYCLFNIILMQQAHAEKADLNKPTNIEADQISYDDIKQINTFTGHVVITRGTLIMKGEKAVVTTDPSGYQLATLFSGTNNVATFRQKRDGGANLWIEGQAKRIEYNSKTDVAKFFSQANLKRLDGAKITDQVEGEYISYDGPTEFFTVNNTLDSKNTSGTNRVKAFIAPRNEHKSK